MGRAGQYIVFNIENEDYGINVLDIYEINRLRDISITPFPKAPYFVEGIINLRGEVVPVINLRKRFGLQPKDMNKESRIIITKLDKKIIGIIVDNITKTIDLLPKNISLTPEGVNINNKYVKCVGKKGEEIITILDIKEVLDTSGGNR